jgi:hypothetical protein
VYRARNVSAWTPAVTNANTREAPERNRFAAKSVFLNHVRTRVCRSGDGNRIALTISLCGLSIREKDRRFAMAKVIEFYVPARFRRPVKWVPQQERGLILEFHVVQKKSA